MPPLKRSDRETVITLRLPKELHQRMTREAAAANRGFAAEVRLRLEASFVPRSSSTTTLTITGTIDEIRGLLCHE